MKKLHFRKTKTASVTRRRRLLNDRPQATAAFSYHSQRAQRLDTPGRQQPASTVKNPVKGLVFWRRRLGFVIGSIIIIVCVVNLLSLSTSPRVEVLSGNSGDYFAQNQAAYQQAAGKVLASSLWNRNKITVNTASVATQLERQFPELGDVSVTLPLVGHRPIVYLQISQPAFIFNAINGSYVLDASGKALALTANVSTAKLRLPVVTDQTGLRARLGEGVLTSADTTFIRTVLAELAARQVAIGEVDLPAGAADELDVHLSGQNYYVKFNMHDSNDAREQAGAFLATQARLKSENITPAQYIDVRVTGRAYYQ